MPVIVGGVIERAGKYLLIQEAKAQCRGKWNFPAGHLDPGETLVEGMKREVAEESGMIVEPKAICQIGNRVMDNDIFVSVIFTTNILGGEPKFDQEKDEILDVKWFSYDEIVAMRDQPRNQTLILGALEHARSGVTAPLDLIDLYD